MLVDDYMPIYDVSDGVAVVTATDPATAWSALMDVDLLELGRRRPLVGLLGGIRVLPDVVAQLLRGEAPPEPPDRLTLKGTTELPLGDGGWVLLGERPGREIALGLVGKFWRPVIEYARVTPDRFREFNEPGYARTIYALSVEALDDGQTLLAGVMRTATTDEHARRWFRRYWTLSIGSGAHVLAHGLLDAARAEAEASVAT